MPIFSNSEQLYQTLKTLFSRVEQQYPSATQSVLASRMSICLRCSEPPAQVFINGRSKTVQISYGSPQHRPDLDVQLTADSLHYILLGELRLRKAIGSGAMKVKGPVLKIFPLEEILHAGQSIYPQLAREQGLG
jgi:hypothetical protein